MDNLNLRNIFLFLHIVSVMLLIGGAIFGTVTFAAMRKLRKTKDLAPIIRLAMKTPALTVPGSLLAFLTGSALVWSEDLPFTTQWILESYAFWILTFALSIAVLKPAMMQIASALEVALKKGKTESKELLAALQSRKLRLAQHAMHLMTFLFLIVMVFKPTI